MIKIIDRLPTEEEYRRVRHLILQTPLVPPPSWDKDQEDNDFPEPPEDRPLPAQRIITDDEEAATLPPCPNIKSIYPNDLHHSTARTLVLLTPALSHPYALTT